MTCVKTAKDGFEKLWREVETIGTAAGATVSDDSGVGLAVVSDSDGFTTGGIQVRVAGVKTRRGSVLVKHVLLQGDDVVIV